jgi:catechol 1,2-dioxygenase
MDHGVSRRNFLGQTSLGLAVAGAAAWTLRADAAPTESSGKVEEAYAIIKNDQPAHGFEPTADNILGPYHRPGAPFRAKITPPLIPGKTLVISGRVWGADTRKPLKNVVLDVWQADANGRYDNDDPKNPPKPNVFLNRARLITDEDGYYEYETVHPGAYQTGPGRWRPCHIHYLVRCPGYKQLITQLYFRGDPYNATDRFVKESLIIDVEDVKTPRGQTFERGVFDIVLAKA